MAIRRLAVLTSGTGSLLASMIKAELPIYLVVADRTCPALEIAAEAGIRTVHHERVFGKDFDQKLRELYTSQMLQILRDHKIDLVAMAGFMTVLSPLLFEEGAYKMRILNTHPSLLPSFKGAHAVQDALACGVKISGCTVHYATAGLDAGPILLQEAVHVHSNDTVESLHERIKEVERIVYPKLLKQLIDS